MVKNRAMGDSVIGLSSISYIKSIFPHAKITYAMPGWIVPLYQNTKGDFDEIYALNVREYRQWPKFFFELSRKKFDLILELHQSGSSGKFLRLLSFLRRIPYHFHNHHLEHSSIIDQGKEKASIQKDLDGIYCALKEFGYLSQEKIPSYLDFPPQLTVPHTEERVRVILGVVASKTTKMWPLENFVSLMNELNRRYRAEFPQLEFYIPLSPSAMDLGIKAKLENLGIPDNATLSIVPLKDLPVQVKGARWYVGNDTGLKHLAVALGVQTFTFFGPERPQEWQPYDLQKHPYLFIDPLECRTVTYHYCPLSTCDSMICLKNLPVSDVMSRVSLSK